MEYAARNTSCHMSDADIVLIILTFLVMLVGMAGVVVPILPDVWLIWLAALGYGLLRQPLFDGWVGALAMVVLTALTALGVIADLVLSHAGAAKGGASWQAILASLALGVVGLFVFPPIGPLVGAVLGLFLVEYLRHDRDARKAWRAVTGYAMGCGASVVARLGIAGLMIVVWGVWVWLAYVLKN
jgi:uncharacterized protein YqgC (DUF456 family)